MTKIKAVLFDFDGTLIDSEDFHYKMWQLTMEEFSVSLEREYYDANYSGIATPINCIQLVKKYALSVTPEELTKRREDLASERFLTEEIKFMPYAQEALEYFYQKKIPMALVTGSTRVDVDFILGKKNLGKYFEFTITRNDVENSKPNPECYLKAIQNFGFEPHEFLVFEDTLSGVTAAVKAGLKPFAVQENPRIREKLSIADKVFGDLNEALDLIESKVFA